MHDIDLIDESFSKNLSHSYQMSIQTCLNGLSFSILDLNKLKYIALRHYPFEGLKDTDEIGNYLSIIYNHDDLLKLKYKYVSHEFIGGNSTLVPKSDFDVSMLGNYLNFVFRDVKNQIIGYNILASDNYCNVFGYPEGLHADLKKYFPGIKLFYHTSSFIEYLIKQSSGSLKSLVYIYINDGLLNIGIAKSGELLFFNSFQYKEKSDIIYFILSVLDQYNLSSKITDVSFSVDAINHDDIFDFLNNYLGQIIFIRPSQQFSYSYLFDELYLTRFANLFNLALCE